jgi:16S rRNA (adenine1518-N6/adenine1519-N6)-dimethyltransferase
MDLCNPAELRPLLERHGFSFSKSLGQNFLIDGRVPGKIAANCAPVSAQDAMLPSVLEIGPGAGALTAALARRFPAVCALELDERLFPLLHEALAEFSNVKIVQGDVLETDLSALVKRCLPEGPVVAAANLPYYITTPAIKALLAPRIFAKVTVMVQKEVAAKLVAKPSESGWCLFSLVVSYFAHVIRLFPVPAGAFFPRPKVDSAVVAFDPKPPLLPPFEEEVFFRLTSAAFAQRRKTLSNALAAAFGREFAAELFSSCKISPNIRGEALFLEDYLQLSFISAEILSKNQSESDGNY